MRGALYLALVACHYDAPPAQDQPDAKPDMPMPDMMIDMPIDMPPSVYSGYSDATTGDTAGFYIYSVWGTSSDASAFAGTFFDFGTVRVKVEIWNIDCNPAGPTESTLFATLPVIVNGVAPFQKYQISKNITQIGSGLVTGNCYRVKPTLDAFYLGFTDLQVSMPPVTAPIHRATPGSNLTVRFRTESSLDVDTDGDGIPDWRDN